MRLIADTNITYYLGNGSLHVGRICQPGETLYISPVVILELIAGMTLKGRITRSEACKAILTSGAVFLKDPETWVREILSLPPIEQPFDWQLLPRAMAESITYNETERKMSFWHPKRNGTGLFSATLDIALLDRWNEQNEQQWFDDVCAPLTKYIPGMAEWIKTKKGRRPELNSDMKNVIRADFADPKMIEDIIERLLYRIVPDPGDRAGVSVSRLASGPLACYASVMRQHITELVLEGAMPQLNDRWDTEFFLYLNDSDMIFVTAEPRWVNIAERAGFKDRVRRIEL